MQRTTRSSYDSTSPRPIGQSFWLLSTMAIAAIVVMAMGDALTAAGGSADGPPYSSQQLLDLANGAATTNPAAPSLNEASNTASTSTSSSTRTLSATQTSAPAAMTAPTTAPTTVTSSTAFVAATGDAPTAEPMGHEARGQAALDRISYPWQELLPGWTITFLPEKSGLYGLTRVPDERIEIYVRENQSLELLAHVIAHELGHAVDVTLNDGSERRLWEEARGLDPSPWWPGSGATDFSTGAGDFAESFAAWQVGDQSFRSELSGAPTAEQMELLAQLAAG